MSDSRQVLKGPAAMSSALFGMSIGLYRGYIGMMEKNIGASFKGLGSTVTFVILLGSSQN